MNHGEVAVRKAAVLATSAAGHHKPALLAPHLGALEPLLYQLTVVRQDLIRVVDYGPFKETVRPACT
jgi:cullin-associated NEDD8-dissociated protein 1